MKKTILYDRAETLYVNELWTYEAIAKELDCSDRTIRNWATSGRWDLKRSNLVEMQENLHQDARDIAALLGKKIKGQLSEDIEPSPHILNAFTRMSLNLLRAREYEKECKADADEVLGIENSIDLIQAKYKEVFGVKPPCTLHTKENDYEM